MDELVLYHYQKILFQLFLLLILFLNFFHNHIFYSGKSTLVNRTWKGIESCKYIRENI